MNQIYLIGRIGKDIELKATESGTSYVKFSLACSRMDKNKTTDWFDLVAWGKTAEIISQYCGKGKQIGVIGQLQTRSYTNNEGKNIKVHEIMVNSLEMLGGDQTSQSQSTAPAPQIPQEAPKAPTKKITEEDEKDASGLIEEDLSDVPLPFEL